jgi:hypothetical protein
MNSLFSDPAVWSRLQFAFTIIFHYLFQQLTMGLESVRMRLLKIAAADFLRLLPAQACGCDGNRKAR